MVVSITYQIFEMTRTKLSGNKDLAICASEKVTTKYIILSLVHA